MSEHPPGQLTSQNYNGTITAPTKSVLAVGDRVFRVRRRAAIRAGYDYPVGDTGVPVNLFSLLFKL